MFSKAEAQKEGIFQTFFKLHDNMKNYNSLAEHYQELKKMTI